MKPTCPRVALLVALLVPAAMAAAQTIQPDAPAAPAATQPDFDDGRPPSPVRAVMVRETSPVRPGEVGVPSRDESGGGVPPALLTGEQLVEEMLRTAGAASGAAGSVPTTEELSGTLGGEVASVRVDPSRPTVASRVEPRDAPPPGRKLLPEGLAIRDRVGFVRREQGRFVFVFEDNTGRDQPLTLLPNTHLQSLLAQSHNARDNVRFRVSGLVTQYQQSNYLLLQMVLMEQDLGRF